MSVAPGSSIICQNLLSSITPVRIANCLRYLRCFSAHARESCTRLLATRSKVEVLGRDSSLVLGAGGSVTAVEPAGPLSVAKEGQWELDANDRMVKLDFKR